MKRPLLWISIIVFLSSGALVWCLSELGFLDMNTLQAAEPTSEKSHAADSAKPPETLAVVAGNKAVDKNSAAAPDSSDPREANAEMGAGKTAEAQFSVQAAEPPTEHGLILKEKQLSEREAVLKEQLLRTDRLITELKEKLKKKEADEKRLLSEMEAGKKQALAAKNAEIVRLKSELKAVRDGRVQNYKSMYEKMESKKAAKILDGLENRLASEILADMKQDKAADILGKMDTEKARKLTEMPFGRRPASKPQESGTSDPNSPLVDLSKSE